jgi:hypothetical protein
MNATLVELAPDCEKPPANGVRFPVQGAVAVRISSRAVLVDGMPVRATILGSCFDFAQ